MRNDSDYVASVTVGGVKLRGNDLRTILSLRSPSFTVEYKDNAFTFHVTGYGHGVGMSQYGANILAKQGLFRRGNRAALFFEHHRRLL